MKYMDKGDTVYFIFIYHLCYTSLSLMYICSYVLELKMLFHIQKASQKGCSASSIWIEDCQEKYA